MKKLKVLLLLLTVFLFFNALAGFTKIYAATNEEDFIFNASNGTITGYKGAGGNVVIPSEIGGVKVTAIGMEAFRSKTTLTSVSIPGTVKTIREYAFLGCTSLKSVNIEYGVTTMNLSVFYGCSELTSISIPDSVTSIGDYSFMNCSKLKSVYLSKNIKTIPLQAFVECTALTDISIPEGVTAIGVDAFAGCTGLKLINFPSTLNYISYNAFGSCVSLERMYLNGTTAPVVNNPPETFYNCNPNITIYVKSGSTGYNIAPWISFQNFKQEVINTVYLTTVSIDPALANGTITANPSTCIALSPISLGVTPNKGWKLKTGSLRYSVGGVDTPIIDYSFIMPLANVVIKADFEKISITSFEDLSSAIKTQNVYVGTELSSLTLPNTLCGKNSDGEFIYIDDVIWQPSPAYNPNTPGIYTFSAEPPAGSGYVFSGTSPSIQVTVSPTPTYTAYITPDSASFHAVAGYGVLTATDFVIYSSGTGTITGLKATLTNGTKFEISGSLTSQTILVGGTAAVKVRPKTGLPAGTYTDTLNITGNNGLSLTANLSFTVDALVNAETPVITSNLTDKTTYLGTAVTLDATATVSDGGTVTYAWYINTIKSTTGATALGVTTGTYSPDVSAAGTAYYYCVVTNTNNSVNGAKTVTITSEIAEVKVNPIPTYTAYITLDSASFHAVAGYGVQAATNFVINSNGTGTITGLIASLTDGTKFEISDSLTSDTISVGGTAAVKVRPKTGLPTGTYTDTLNITGNNGLSITASLSFTVDALVNAETPVITSNLTDKTTYVGTAVTLDATATVNDGGTVTYSWYKNTIRSTTGATALGVTTDTYFPDVSAAGTTYYYCVVTNTNNSVNGAKTEIIISEIAEVMVTLAPTYTAYITPDSASFHATSGYGVQATTNFVINSTGTGTITGLIASLMDGTKFEISDSLTSDTILVGGTVAVKVRPKTGLSAGTYTDTLNITGNNGLSITASLSFTVDALVNAETPVITSNLTDKTTYVGTAVTLDATATVNDGGTVTYSWYKNTIRSTTGATALGVTTDTYFPDVSAAGTAYYYCVVTNTNNSVNGAKKATITSEIAEVKVNPIPTYTAYITPDSASFHTVAGYGVQAATNFVINSTGTGIITGLIASLTDGTKFEISDSLTSDTIPVGGTAAVKVRPKTGLSAGTYTDTLNITGNNGLSITASLSFTVDALVNAETPVITSNLTDKTTYVGTAVTLDATSTVNDGGTVTCAWYKNTIKSTTGATALGVTTSNYSPDVSAAGTAYYYCVVTNTNNSVNGAKTAIFISEIAEVKVNTAPVAPLITGPTEMSLTEGYNSTSTEVYNISGTAPVTVIKISGDDKIIWNETTKKLNIGADLTAGSYPISLKASNGISPDATLNFTLTVNPAPVVNSASISPTSVYYDLTAPADVVTHITWNSASTVTDVVYGTTSLTTPDVYAVSGSALTINSSYINTLGASEGDEAIFTIFFDKGDSVNLTITIVESFIPADNAELNKLMVNGNSVIGFDPETTIYSVELPYGTSTAMVTATPEEEHATVVITQAPSLPGSATILVTAQDTITVKTYTINFTLEPGPIDKTLVSIAPLSPITGLANGTVKTIDALGLPSSLTLMTDDGNVSASIIWSLDSSSYNAADTAQQTFTVDGTVVLPSGVVNPNGVSLDVTISVTVVAATAPLPYTSPAITTAVLPNGMVGSTYSQTLTATGDTPITWEVIGSLPNGLTLSGSIISGTPTMEGTFSFTVKAENSEGSDTKTLSIYINPAPSYNNGGGTSDNSSITQTVVPDKKPDQPVIAIAQLTSTVNAKGKATLKVPRQTVVDTINKATSEAEQQGRTANGIGISLDVKNPDGTKSISIVLTQSTLKLLIDSKVRQFEVNDSLLSLQFNLEALKQIQAQSTKDVTINLTPVTKLSNEAKKLIGTRQVYNVTLSYVKDNKTVNITSLNSGSVILSIPYTLGEIEDSAYLFGVYVNDKGNATQIPDSTYDANTGEIIFGSNHFSIYGVGYTVPSAKFTDISTHWAKESIDYVVSRGLLAETSETTFSPDTPMSRGMLATALSIMAGADVSGYKTSSFTDVKVDSTYLPHIEWAYKQGIISSIGIQQFAPDKPVTREEISEILQNYAKVTGYTLPITREANTFTDSSSISIDYMDAVKAMQQAGIMNSKNNGYFDPKSSATRAEIAAILYRYIKLTIDPATAQGWSRNDSGQLLYYKYGKALTGWQTIDAKVYYFDSKGVASSKGLKQNDKGDWYMLQ